MKASILYANEGGGIMRGAIVTSRVARSSYGIVSTIETVGGREERLIAIRKL
jgi:hypothetical protein